MKNADRPAYPKTKGEHDCGFTVDDCHGLTKREYFAAMAMQGFLGNSNMSDGIIRELGHFPSIEDGDRALVRTCIRIADELLKQLETK